jgi:hypothetical protein
MLERLATKAKRISNAVGNCGENAEGGPKKIKLILNKLGSNLSTPHKRQPRAAMAANKLYFLLLMHDVYMPVILFTRSLFATCFCCVLLYVA